MTIGTFIISLDCEGKWGFADALEPYHHRMLTSASIATAYRSLTRLFGGFEIPATFAFVMAFTLTHSERREFSHLLDEARDPWLNHFHTAEAQGLGDGWFQPEALDIAREGLLNEIACHSFCHRPLGENDISEESALTELEAAAAVARLKGLALETFVYPRNQIGHIEALRKLGYIGYRRSRRPARIFPRIMAIASEFNIWAGPELHGTPGAPAPLGIPAGYFFNWRFGMRRCVPPALTVLRWKNLLDRAANEGKVAHLWLHPHNLITGPGTFEPLAKVVAYAATLRDGGRLRVMTQRDYCRDLLAADSIAGAEALRPPHSPKFVSATSSRSTH